jgi:hypothetical protein
MRKRKRGFTFRTQNTEHRTRNTEHGTQNTEHRTRNSEHGTQNTRIFNTINTEEYMSELSEKIKESLGDDGKIKCSDAFRIAKEEGVSPGAVGKEINRLKIKIKGCQLGCF